MGPQGGKEEGGDPMKREKSVSIRTVAAEAGVSTATVSRVIAGGGGVSPEAEARVRAAAQRLGYVPNAMARGLRKHSLPLVGIIVPDIVNEFFSRIVLNVQLALARQGYSVFICNTDESHQLEQTYVASLQTMQIGGLVCISGYDRPDEEWPDVPTVYIDRDPQHRAPKATVIESDNESGGYQAAREVLRRGCRRVALLRDARAMSTSVSREAGCRRALADAGIPVDESLLLRVPRVDEAHAYDAVSFAIREGKTFDALVCFTDWLALGACRALSNAHLRVPQDVCVTGYDDVSVARYAALPMTTIRQDVDEMSRIAVEELVRMMEGGSCRREHWVIPVTLIRRETT